jgi:hypothetical protein
MAEDGTWLTDIPLSAPEWKPGDRIPRDGDTLEVVEVRAGPQRRSIESPDALAFAPHPPATLPADEQSLACATVLHA